MAVSGLSFCAGATSCGEWGPLFIAVRGPLTIVASLVAEHRLQTRRLSNCGSRAQLLRRMWDLPRPGLEPASPALAGRFSTTAPPGKPQISFKSEDSCIQQTFTDILPVPFADYVTLENLTSLSLNFLSYETHINPTFHYFVTVKQSNITEAVSMQ